MSRALKALSSSQTVEILVSLCLNRRLLQLVACFCHVFVEVTKCMPVRP